MSADSRWLMDCGQLGSNANLELSKATADPSASRQDDSALKSLNVCVTEAVSRDSLNSLARRSLPGDGIDRDLVAREDGELGAIRRQCVTVAAR